MSDNPRTNRLAGETSPYLRQHAHNPVDWYPWGAEALDRARREDKPIFLSIGYSACHWCHVMERESFESEAVAAVLNEAFVSIKVDREERPDLDDIYMAAVVAMTGQGGWPMTVFLTPDLEPFYGGTYFPPTDALGRPGFTTVLRAVEDAWRNKRGEVLRGAAGLTSHVRQQMTAEVAPGPVTAALLDAAADQLRDSFDGADGGWGGAPKFPSGATIGLLLRQYARTGEEDLLRMATHTLDRMALGGLHDHVGGGFHRYSVDGQWLVPHFEKMLYDNAQLSLAYLEAYQLTGEERYAGVIRDTLDYELRDMRDARGGFHSAEDADSEGEEGKFYLWTAAEVDAVLGAENATLFREAYQVRSEGNFASHEPYHGGQNIPHLAAPAGPALEARLAPMRVKLLAARAERTRPGLDDKVLTSWNALMITSLARASRVLGEARYRRAAEEAGRFLLDHMVRDGVLLRTHRQGESRLEGYLDDYAFTVNAFVDLYEATFDAAWLREADALTQGMADRFWDEDRGVFYFTAPAQADLIVRARPTFDNAEPSGNSVAAHALLRLGRLMGRPHCEARGRRVLEANAALMARAPQGFPRMLWAVDFLLHPGGEIVVAGAADHAETRAFLDAIHRRFLPNTVTALADPGAPEDGDIPLLEGKGLVDGRPAVYLCRDYTCERPVTDAADLEARLVDMTRRSG